MLHTTSTSASKSDLASLPLPEFIEELVGINVLWSDKTDTLTQDTLR